MPARHGSQKVAQKSSSTTSLPRCSLKRSLLPSVVESSKSGGASCACPLVLGSDAPLPALGEHPTTNASTALANKERRSITTFRVEPEPESNRSPRHPWSLVRSSWSAHRPAC